MLESVNKAAQDRSCEIMPADSAPMVTHMEDLGAIYAPLHYVQQQSDVTPTILLRLCCDITVKKYLTCHFYMT